VAVTERGVTSGYHGAIGTSITVTLPAGIAVGDLLMLFTSNPYAQTVPSGWSTSYNSGSVAWVNGTVSWIIATSSEVAAGTATYTISSSYKGSWFVIAIVGGTFSTAATNRVAATASSTASPGSWVADNAFERQRGDVGYCWASSTSSMPQWLQVQVVTAQVATGYTIKSRLTSPNQTPNTWTFLGSNDGSSWNTLDTRSGESGWTGNEARTYTFSNSIAYTYYRINITAINGGSSCSINNMIIAGVSTDLTGWSFDALAGIGSLPTPPGAVPITKDVGQRMYYIAMVRCDGDASGGTITGSSGSISVQRTTDPFWESSLYYEDAVSFGAVEPIWSGPASTVKGWALFNIVLSPSLVMVIARRPTIVASRAAQRASRW